MKKSGDSMLDELARLLQVLEDVANIESSSICFLEGNQRLVALIDLPIHAN